MLQLLLLLPVLHCPVYLWRKQSCHRRPENLHTVCVSILNNTYPGLTGIHSDLITVGIIVEGSSPWSVFFPGDIDGLSVYNIFSYIWFINVDVQITVFIVFSPGRILQNDVFIGESVLRSADQSVCHRTGNDSTVCLPDCIQTMAHSGNIPVLRHLLLSHPEVPLHHLRRRRHNQAGSPQRIPDITLISIPFWIPSKLV